MVFDVGDREFEVLGWRMDFEVWHSKIAFHSTEIIVSKFNREGERERES